jgi:integrase
MAIADFAVTRKLITTDMFLLTKIYSEEIKGQEAPPRRYVIWSKEEYRMFIDTFHDNDRNKILFQLMFFSGCRTGEIRALTWNDYIPERKMLIIDKSIISKTGTGQFLVSTTKTKTGNRVIWLSNQMNERLLRLRNHYTDWTENKYIFFNAAKPLGHTTITRYFDRHIQMAGLPHMRLHDIRHTSNTWLHNLASSREEEEAIKKRFGHASDAMSLGTYYHHGEDAERRLADLIDI